MGYMSKSYKDEGLEDSYTKSGGEEVSYNALHLEDKGKVK